MPDSMTALGAGMAVGVIVLQIGHMMRAMNFMLKGVTK